MRRGLWILLLLIGGHPAWATFTLAHQQNVTSGCGGATSCSPSLTVTGGRLGVLLMVDSQSGETISSVTGGGTWSTTSTCNSNNGNGSVSCAYTLSTSTASSVTVTFAITATAPTLFYFEYSFTGSSVSLETGSTAALETANGSTVTGPTATITGTNDVVLSAGGVMTATAVNSPWGNLQANGGHAAADHENTTSGTGATYSTTANYALPVSTLAFSEASSGGATPAFSKTKKLMKLGELPWTP